MSVIIGLRAEKGSDPGSRRLLPLLLHFSFDLPWLAHTDTVKGRGGGVIRGVRGMDAAAKPQGWVHGVPA
ncbi:hypothetical protein, partial [Stenotrophomonas pavanii]|uniref:hypothetical protein n=1 Tax=Stenotrophomonas pavanii TaxID=487698 RepID=UPI0039C6B3FB